MNQLGNSLPFYGAPEREKSRGRILEALRNFVRLRNSRILGSALLSIARVASLVTGRPPHSSLRAVICAGLPIDPLRSAEKLEPVEVVIPFVEKDIIALEYCVQSVMEMVTNPITRIRLITPVSQDTGGPRLQDQKSRETLERILGTSQKIAVEFDHEVLGPLLMKEITEDFPGGWVVQQLVKLSSALNSDSGGVLIVDSDSVLLSPKSWLTTEGVQLLQLSHEYDERYMPHVRNFFGLKKSFLMSYVTHHQLFQPDIVKVMFPKGEHSLLAWWHTTKGSEGSFLSEYEAYGTFIRERHPSRTRLGSWSNLLSPRLHEFVDDATRTGLPPHDMINDYCSVSFHSHAQGRH